MAPSLFISVVNCLLFFSFSLLSLRGATAQSLTGKDAKLQVKHTHDFEVTGKGTDPAWNTTDWIPLSRIKGASPYTTRVK